MSAVDDVLKYAYRARGEYRSLRHMIGRAKAEIVAGRSIIQVAQQFAGDHLDNMADARARIAGRRIAAIRSTILGPRPAYKVITEAEYLRQVELARELMKCTDAAQALKLCAQAIIEAMELIERHDTLDVMVDVEPIVMIAIDAHEQAIAWYEQNNLRITHAEFKLRQAQGRPHLAAEYVARAPVSALAIEGPRPGEDTPPPPVEAPAAEAPDSTNPTADPT